MKRVLPVVATGLAFAACSPSRRTAVQHIDLDTIAVTAKPLAKNRYQASATRAWDILHTDIALRFDWAARTAAGVAVLQAMPYAYEQDSLWLDAKSMDVQSVSMQASGAPDVTLRYEQQGDSLLIHWPRRIAARQQVSVRVQYTAKPYGQVAGGSDAIRDERGLYFINPSGADPYKPRQIWTQGETESNSHWFPTIDKPNERFTIQLALEVPDTMTTLSNGVLVAQRKEAGGLRTDVWRMDQPIQAYAVMAAIGRFSKVLDTPWQGKEIAYYVEPEYAPSAGLMFRNTPAMVDFFSKKTGVAYPWPKYSQVVVRDYVSGAMENTSASLFGEFVNGNAQEVRDKNYEDVVSHELFHQWFGDYVTAESWANLTVNESFATYGEVLWREHAYGRAAADALRYDDLQRYLASTNRADPPLVRFGYADKEDMFDRVSYQKGGAILHYIRTLAGDAAFDRAMNLYLSKNALQAAEAHQWRLALEEATGRDWNPLFNQWYFRGGHPELEVRYRYDDKAGEAQIITTQKNTDLYDLPLQVVVRTGRASETLAWNIQKRTDTMRYRYTAGGPRPVFFPDADQQLPGLVREQISTAARLEQLQLAPGAVVKRRVLAAVTPVAANDTTVQVYRTALVDGDANIRRAALQRLLAASDTGLRHSVLIEPVRKLAASDTTPDIRATAIRLLGAWKRSGERRLFEAGVQDVSYAVSGAGLYALNRLDTAAAYQAARTLLAGDVRKEQASEAMQIVARRGFATDLPLLTGKREAYNPAALALFAAAADSSSFAIALELLKQRYNVAQPSFRPAQLRTWKQLVEALDDTEKLSRTEVQRRLGLIRTVLQGWQASEDRKGTQDDLRELLQELR